MPRLQKKGPNMEGIKHPAFAGGGDNATITLAREAVFLLPKDKQTNKIEFVLIMTPAFFIMISTRIHM